MSSNSKSADKVQEALRTASELSTQVDEAQTQQENAQLSHDQQLAAETAVETAATSVGAAVETVRPETVAESAFAQYDEVSGLSKSVVLQWEGYVQDANPAKRQTLSSLKTLQTTLANLITTTFNLEDDNDFVVVMGRLMQLVRDNQFNVFGAENIFRGFSSLNLSDKRINALRHAMDAVLTFSDPNGRKNALRYYNLQQSTTICRTVPARERFIGYITRISE